MGKSVQFRFEMPDDMAGFRLPASVQRRLQRLLDLQDQGKVLTSEEREEAEALVNMAEILTLLKLRSETAASE